ncbi:MAG: hypothetical protein ABI977_15055 [Acidobacteriota bacterium]
MNTPTLEQVYHDAQRLPLEDRRALATLIEPPKSLEEIAAEQGVGPFDFKAAQQEAADIWPEDESADDFVAAVREWRSEGLQRELD